MYITFVETSTRSIENRPVMPPIFLNEKVLKAIAEIVDYIPSIVYVSNSAGDWFFISFIYNGLVYTYTDNYDIELDFKLRDTLK